MSEPQPGSAFSFRHFMAGILDLRFTRYLSMQLLPLFYALLLLGALGVLVLVTALAFWLSPWAGLVMLLLAPLGFLVAAAVIRAALEFLVMAYRIMETVNRMDRIPSQVDNLNTKVDGISAEFDLVAAQVHHIRGQVDGVTETTGILRQILHPLSLPARMARSYTRRNHPS